MAKHPADPLENAIKRCKRLAAKLKKDVEQLDLEIVRTRNAINDLETLKATK
jgi:prefoldin subunit 5